jgi:hypothetical protein
LNSNQKDTAAAFHCARGPPVGAPALPCSTVLLTVAHLRPACVIAGHAPLPSDAAPGAPSPSTRSSIELTLPLHFFATKPPTVSPFVGRQSSMPSPLFPLSTPSLSSPTTCPHGPQVARQRQPPGTPSPSRIWAGASPPSASLGELHPLKNFIVDWASPHPLPSPS